MDGPTPRNFIYCFEQCRLDPVSRSLTRCGQTIRLPGRLFDTLLYLVENEGKLADRDALMRAVWPGRVVDDNSIARAISSLRATLKDQGAPDSLIVTVAGRGYRFGAITVMESRGAMPADTVKLPASVAAIVMPPRRWPWVAMPILTVCVAVTLSWWAMRPPASVRPAPGFAPPPRSVAVLPFTNMSDDPREGLLADGIADELIDALGRIGGVRVAARRSSFLFKSRQADIADIARKLNVATVLEGSIRRDGTRVRITAQLIDTVSGFQVWSRSYDRGQGDLLTLEAEIAQAVIASLQIVLLPQENARLSLGGTTNPAAFDAFLTGLSRSISFDWAVSGAADGYFTRAIELDPNYAMAYVERATTRARRGGGGPIADVAASRRLIGDAVHDAEQAVAMAPDLGEAHAALGMVLLWGVTDFNRAGTEFTRAIDLAPGNARVVRLYAWSRTIFGQRAPAIQAARLAVELDPLSPSTYRTLARILSVNGQYEDALAALRQAERLPSDDPSAGRLVRGLVELDHGDAAAASAACEGGHDPLTSMCLAVAYHGLGRQAEADAALATLRAVLGDNGAIQYAEIYAAWGRQKDALHWLQEAFRLRDPGLGDMRFDPLLLSLRSTVEYRAIEQALHFPP